MKTETFAIEQLRQRLLSDRSGRLGDEMITFSRVLLHPEVTWSDLLDSLSRPEVISDMSALALHLLLQRSRNKGPVERDRLVWEAELRRLQIPADDHVISWVDRKADLTDKWKRFRNGLQIM